MAGCSNLSDTAKVRRAPLMIITDIYTFLGVLLLLYHTELARPPGLGEASA